MQPHPFTLRQLQYALAVDEAGGFRKAADRCHVSQPALSAQLAQLEGALGAQLFERGRRGILLTAAGRELLGRARQVLLAADQLLTAASSLGDPLSGSLRIGIVPTVSPYLLPELVPALRRELPRLTLQWSEERTFELLAGLREGRLDAALLAKVTGMDDLEVAPLTEDRFVLAGSRNHPLLQRRGLLQTADLDGERLLLLDDGHCFRDQALEVCAKSGAQEEDFRATSLSTLAQMAASGAGLTLLPELALPLENRRGELSVRRFARPGPGRQLVLAFRRGSPFVVALRELGRVIRAVRPAPTQAAPQAR